MDNYHTFFEHEKVTSVFSEFVREEDVESSTSGKRQVLYHSDVCSICMDQVDMMIGNENIQCSCCGKLMHFFCICNLLASELNDQVKGSCPFCRAKFAVDGAKEEIRRLHEWVSKKKRWAQLKLAGLYSLGVGVKQDVTRAFKLYKLAADQGHHMAQFNLGLLYSLGRGVDQSDTLAFRYDTLAAQQGFGEAQYNVGFCYFHGEGVTQSDEKAREWLEKAALQGIEQAISNLQVLDEKEGKSTMSTAATSSSTITTTMSTAVGRAVSPPAGDFWNYFDLRRHLLCANCNKPETDTNHLRRCSCASAGYCSSTCKTEHWQTHKRIHRMCMEKLSMIDSEGEMKDEITADDKKETASSTLTHSKSTHRQEEQGDCVICSKALPKDASKFMRNTCCGSALHAACNKQRMENKSLTDKQKSICDSCRTPLQKNGTKKEIKQLRRWVKKGKTWSMQQLGERYQNGTGVDQSWEKAASFYKMAADRGDANSMTCLGFQLCNGFGVEKDVQKAKDLWIKAAVTSGNITAIKNLRQLDTRHLNTTPSFTPIPNYCAYCGKSHNPPTLTLNACDGCGCVFYCSKKCQRIDWKLKVNGHKNMCKIMQHDYINLI